MNLGHISPFFSYIVIPFMDDTFTNTRCTKHEIKLSNSFVSVRLLPVLICFLSFPNELNLFQGFMYPIWSQEPPLPWPPNKQ
uniref:Putative ovule protein n=1 Tax=Solanum chacoense TaxID=4108 RepID=A0A0V0GRJ4_SOLCH